MLTSCSHWASCCLWEGTGPSQYLSVSAWIVFKFLHNYESELFSAKLKWDMRSCVYTQNTYWKLKSFWCRCSPQTPLCYKDMDCRGTVHDWLTRRYRFALKIFPNKINRKYKNINLVCFDCCLCVTSTDHLEVFLF